MGALLVLPLRYARRMQRTILTLVLAVLLCACSSEPEVRRPKMGDASPLLFDFTKQPEPKPGEPIDPATCKHAWVPSRIHSHPYQAMVNGMPMTRMCFAQRCSRCGLVRHECARRSGPLSRPRRDNR